jgi:exosortase C (VPDSG-CTERM-specific)
MMNPPNKAPTQPAPEARGAIGSNRRALFWCAMFALALTLCFSQSLYVLARFALRSDLYSHIILVPFVSIYLIWIKRSSLTPPSPLPARKIALTLLFLGALVLAGSLGAEWKGIVWGEEDHLASRILPYVLFLAGTCAWFFDRATLRTVAFPLAFLLFMVPFPSVIMTGLETFLQHGSATTAYAMFKLSGTTVFYDDLIFRLPGISLEVAPECSGIRSSLALFITSLVAGYFFLRTPWKCAVLSLVVIPLAILRNGFRIYVIGELCVHISPDMINSYIHRQGGPIFFLLSLIPFFFLLRLLFRSESHRSHPTSTPFAS